jgi:hypothetical protein
MIYIRRDNVSNAKKENITGISIIEIL